LEIEGADLDNVAVVTGLLSLLLDRSRAVEEAERRADRAEGEAATRIKSERELRIALDQLGLKSAADSAELARTTVALQLEIESRQQLANERNRLAAELDQALARIKDLTGTLPICASCKKVRDDRGKWNSIESYIKARSQTGFSHSICPDCEQRVYEELRMVRQ
jgi:hypothetical protein